MIPVCFVHVSVGIHCGHQEAEQIPHPEGSAEELLLAAGGSGALCSSPPWAFPGVASTVLVIGQILGPERSLKVQLS